MRVTEQAGVEIQDLGRVAFVFHFCLQPRCPRDGLHGAQHCGLEIVVFDLLEHQRRQLDRSPQRTFCCHILNKNKEHPEIFLLLRRLRNLLGSADWQQGRQGQRANAEVRPTFGNDAHAIVHATGALAIAQRADVWHDTTKPRK